MELGRAIVRQLELDRRGELPTRWMAHHLAELIATAESVKGAALREAEDRAAELVMKLWSIRSALPGAADPLIEFRAAIKVLEAMMPSANPWRLSRGNTADALLSEMFGAMALSIMAGLLLTRSRELRNIDEAEWNALSEEERLLAGTLALWQDLLGKPQPRTSALASFLSRLGEFDWADDDELRAVVAKDAPDTDRSQRDTVLSHLESFQTQLAKLIEQWRAVDARPGSGEAGEICES